MLQLIGKAILALGGWKIVDKTPLGVNAYPKAVVIAAPHTSNWDYLFAMAILKAINSPCAYLAKASLFKFPLGLLVKGLGGIPVNRNQKNNLVQNMASLIQQTERIHLMVPAEGTRSLTKEWKSGFYYMALEAKVPIILGFLDFAKKEGGFLDVFYPTGNYEQDLQRIQAYYYHITPKHPAFFSLNDVKRS